MECTSFSSLDMQERRRNRARQVLWATTVLSFVACDHIAVAADMPVKAPQRQAPFDWTGLYIGAHAGFSRGSSSALLADPSPTAISNVYDGMIGGVQAGYNYRLPSGLLLGAEADFTFPNYLTSNS